jgi:flagella basal body P-ring formation protein FlgA
MATLEIVAPEMVITIPVVCLENGHQGEQIKVLSTDRKSAYLGEIIRPGLLRQRL